MLLFDYIGNRALEELEKNFKNYLNEKELQKILLGCFKDAEIKIDDSIKREILDIDSEKIKPNMSKQEIEENLKELFSNIFDNNEEYSGNAKSKKDYISSEYLKRARKNILELHHILEVLDDVKADITVLIEASERQEKTSKKVDELYNEMRKRGGSKIHFIDGLDDTKVFYYCELEICGEHQVINSPMIDEILEDLVPNTGIPFYVECKDNVLFSTVTIQFCEPVSQGLFKVFLSNLNELFYEKDIIISKITSHF